MAPGEDTTFGNRIEIKSFVVDNYNWQEADQNLDKIFAKIIPISMALWFMSLSQTISGNIHQ